jgi:hypothetical protein
MTDDDTMDVLTGFGVLLALALFAAAWFTPSRNGSPLGEPLSRHFAVKAPAPAPPPTIIV